jgi:uncharacterized protein (DUF58 family)
MTITSRGVGLLVAGVVLLVAGFRFGYAELALLGTAGLVAVGCAVGHLLWRPRLAVDRVADPDRVGRGEPATMTLTVRNTGRLRSANLVAQDRCGDQAVAVPLLRLRPGRDTTVSYPVPTSRRGVIPVGPLRVVGRDALGLLSLSRGHGEIAYVWVHPRIHPLNAVPTGVTRSLDGRIDKVPHGSITFDSLREYVVGDELRRVHWRTSARVGELMVREHLDTSLPRLVVLLDNRTGAHPALTDGVAETFESACEAAASVVAAARREDLPVTLLLVADDRAADESAPGAAGRAPTGPGLGTTAGAPTSTGGIDDLDRLAAAVLRREPGDDPVAPLRTTTTRLRQDRLGDTLVFLTGPGARADLGYLEALRGAYPSVLVAVFGGGPGGPTGASRLLVIEPADGADFAAEWDGVRRW